MYTFKGTDVCLRRADDDTNGKYAPLAIVTFPERKFKFPASFCSAAIHLEINYLEFIIELIESSAINVSTQKHIDRN